MNLALDQDPSDAEAQIYLEDQKVLASHQPYITIVVPTALTGNAIVGGRDNLQGVYLAQKEYNDPRNKQLNGRLVLILVANSGSIDDYVSVTRVAQQIVLLAQNDPTFVGVMGWPRSQSALYALPLLTAHDIPMVSDLASSDNLAGKSFFRVVPPNQRQGVVDAKYAEQTLNAKNIALFEDPNNQYSSTLAEDFKKQFTADGKSIAFTEYYTVGKPQTLPSCLQHALTHSPDLIYFSGYTEDIGTLLTALPTYTQFSHLQVLGGDALYELNYPSSAHAAYNRLHFTAFAFFDEWDWSQIPKSQQPSFFKEYPKVFNPDNLTYPNPYGHTRASSDVILAYDATLALLKGYQEVLMGGKQSISPADLQEALTHTAFQGASGYIDLASPNEKPFVVLCVNSQKQLQIESVQGCLLGSCPLQDSVRKRSACAS